MDEEYILRSNQFIYNLQKKNITVGMLINMAFFLLILEGKNHES